MKLREPLLPSSVVPSRRLLFGRIPLVKAVSTAIGLPLFVVLLYTLPGTLFALLISLIAALGVWEFGHLAGLDHGDRWRTAFVGGVLPLAMYWGPHHLLPLLVCGLLLLLLAGDLFGGRDVRESMGRITLAVFGVLYVAWLLGFIVLLRAMPAGQATVIWLFVATWGGDLGAGVTGMLMGRHHLPPRINARKTWEGIIGGVVVSVVATLLLAPEVLLLDEVGLLVVGLLVGLAAQAGDLSESLLKRSVGAVDSGAFVPGQGGVLDRIDSLLFTAPVAYALVALF
ncbi:MAG: phosphatidate cytidylyltransferase [Chloroflexaceae bacterium]|nr:phosphatidate cytidylyltransferase [Chloroflexaceae bacterium]